MYEDDDIDGGGRGSKSVRVKKLYSAAR